MRDSWYNKLMFLVGIFQWWYGEGWRRHARLSGLGILRMADFFSIGLLARTLFSPYRQISAGRVRGPLPVQLRAFADRLFSRVIGGVFRTILIFVGMIAIAGRAAWTGISLVVWTILPLTPLIGVVLWRLGVAP